jgi:hypothetical protein
MSESIQEFVDSGQARLRVDRAAGIIRGVKLLGLTSRNGRRYREAALVEAAGLYEGAKVNINHPKGHPLSPRDYQDRLGVIRGVEFRAGDGLFGDLHFNPKHALSEQLVWDSEHAPQNVGLSHNVLARIARSGDETVVEAITKVQSIDLVADPATTAGLFEQVDGRESRVEGRGPDDGSARPILDTTLSTLDSLTIEQLELHRPDLLQELREGRDLEIEQLRGRFDELAAREAAAERRRRITELFVEHGLPLPGRIGNAARQIVSEQFMQSLMNAGDDATLRRLVKERAELVHAASNWIAETDGGDHRPRSRHQSLPAGETGRNGHTAAEFAAAVRGR